MKPLLIIPPAPARWESLQDLLKAEGATDLADVEVRINRGLSGADDAYAVVPANGRLIAGASINKCGHVGVLSHVFTRPEHRGQGHARRLTQTVLSWFDMTGGKWLYLATTAELDEGLYRKFGFEPIRRAVWAPFDRMTMLRLGKGVSAEPLADLTGETTVRALTRVDWPEMVAMLQYVRGPDPRVPLGESAVTAQVLALDLVVHQERGACQLFGAFRGGRLVGMATVATDQPAERTYAMLMPHTDTPAALREAVAALARERGYAHVDFPMEALALAGGKGE
jgi:GNAT superfamily N-acetyltransferase